MSKERPLADFVGSQIERLKQQADNERRRSEQERQAKINESMRVMKQLGVTNIFESLRDSGKLAYYRNQVETYNKIMFGRGIIRRYIDKVEPARIEYGDQFPRATILFDALKKHNYTDSDAPYIYEDPHIVYVEQRPEGVFIGGSTPSYAYRGHYTPIPEIKVGPLYQLPQLISKAIFTVNPNVQTSNPPKQIQWF